MTAPILILHSTEYEIVIFSSFLPLSFEKRRISFLDEAWNVAVVVLCFFLSLLLCFDSSSIHIVYSIAFYPPHIISCLSRMKNKPPTQNLHLIIQSFDHFFSPTQTWNMVLCHGISMSAATVFFFLSFFVYVIQWITWTNKHCVVCKNIWRWIPTYPLLYMHLFNCFELSWYQIYARAWLKWNHIHAPYVTRRHETNNNSNWIGFLLFSFVAVIAF